MAEVTWKVYSPLQADFFTEDEYGDIDFHEENAIPFSGTDLILYEDSIQKEIDRYGGRGDDLAEYIHDDCGAEYGVQINQKVLSIVPSVESVNGELVGCATVKLREPLTREETAALCSYLEGQYSDGWGEGFEQREINVDDGVLLVHFWNGDRFSMEIDRNPQTEQVVRPPKLRIDLSGAGGNLFVVLAIATEHLTKHGQTEQAGEMCLRVFSAANYDAALAIMGEYMEIEYIRPAQQDRSKKPKKKGGDAR